MDLQQAKALRWVAKYIREFIIVALVAANAIQYKNTMAIVADKDKFQIQVYENEKLRVTKWEDIVLTLRGSSQSQSR